MLYTSVVSVSILLSTHPWSDVSRITPKSSFKFIHWALLFIFGHAIRSFWCDVSCLCCAIGSSSFKLWLLSWNVTDAERFLALWFVSWLGFSCVSPDKSVRCSLTIPRLHPDLYWWIFKPLWFLQIFPQWHLASAFSPVKVVCTICVVVRFRFLVVAVWSVWLSLSSSPPLGRLWGYTSLFCVVAVFGVPSRKPH